MKYNDIIHVKQPNGLQPRQARLLAIRKDEKIVMVQWLDSYVVEWIKYDEQIAEYVAPRSEPKSWFEAISETFDSVVEEITKSKK